MNLQSQMLQLGVAWLLAAAGMLLVLLLQRADRRAFFRWPVYSAMAMAVGVILWNLLRKHVFPADWLQGHTPLMYWGALAMYLLLGLSFGLLLGRITRRPPEGEKHEN
jgi:ribose/xylose/arabinose/galactoside ABC-type transport system permease subunit